MEVNWILVTSRAKRLYANGKELYLLHKDGSESLIEDESEIDAAIEKGISIGMEDSFFEDLELGRVVELLDTLNIAQIKEC